MEKYTEKRMKKCPRCKKLDEENVRFCKTCNTELFFEYRFPDKQKKAKKK